MIPVSGSAGRCRCRGAVAAEPRGRGAVGGETPAGKGCPPARVPVQGWAAGPERGGGTHVSLTSRRVSEQPGGQQPRRHGHCAPAPARPRPPETTAPRHRHLR